MGPVSIINARQFRWGICPAVLVGSAFLLPITLGSYRLLPAIVFPIVVVLWLTLMLHNRLWLVIACWILFLLVCVLPFDISFRNVPGPPRFVPLQMGLVTGLNEEAARGDVILGSCTETGLEPKWILVW
jgi:hypothetical protein